ncbi:hypothetical protein BOTU111921_18285 [Bordetella tumbae]|uniref:beta-ketoacyl synthase N-terminal-like domain-containing protein n=1 Tax=Bordetella tumbae TaxID=1649139 RepID=UPI0039EF6A19
MSVLVQDEPEVAVQEYGLEQHLSRLLYALLAQQGWLSAAAGLAPRYARWHEAGLRMLREQGVIQDSAQWDWETSWSQWQTYREQARDDAVVAAQLRLLDVVLPALPAILRGERAATDVLFPQGQLGLVEGVYRDHPVADYFNGVLGERLDAYVRARVSHDPRAKLRIVEIGAGTGGTSAGLFTQLAAYAEHIEEYCYTDVSPAFLLHAREHYAAQAPYLQTKRLDIEHTPVAQGFALGHFDVAVAANVLHATRDMRSTLRHVKTLLKGNGLLLLNELSAASLFLHLSFGLLEGWWLAEDEEVRIPGTPALSLQGWREVLTAEGFGAIEAPAQAAHELGQQVIVATSDGLVQVQSETKTLQEEPRVLMPSHESKASTPAPMRVSAEIAPRRDSAQARNAIRTSIAQTLKVSEADLQDDQPFSTYGIDSVTGVALINAINMQLGLMLPTTVLFDHATIEELGAHISAISPTIQEPSSPVALSVATAMPTPEAPVEKIKAVPIGRGRRRRGEFTAAPPLAAQRGAQITGPLYRRVWLERPGTIDDLHIREDRLPPLGAHDVRIAVRAFSLNFGDLLCVKGLYPTQPAYPFTPGFEASGVVVAIGSKVSRVAVGDAVIALAGSTFGAHATALTCAETRVFACPTGLSFEAACAVPGVALTMIECFKKAQLKPGERILIQTATGGVGLIAVQLAKHAGAEIYATAGSEAKLDYLASLGVPHRINYQEEDFEAAIERLTDGQGMDVVINTLPGDAVQKGLNCLASGGRYIEIAMTALKSARSIDLSGLTDNQALYSVDVNKLSHGKLAILQNSVLEMGRLLADGVISPTVGRTFNFNDIQSAYRWLQDRRNIGKVVVSIPQEDRLDADEPIALTPQLEPIAVIGMSGRFPGAPDVNAFWDNLINNRDCIVEIPENRWNLDGFFNSDREEAIKKGMSYCKWGGFIEFDGRSPKSFLSGVLGSDEPDSTPYRLAVESIWSALESSGYTRSALKKSTQSRTGLYLGMIGELRGPGSDAAAQPMSSGSSSALVGHISKFFNFTGPTIAVDTLSASSATSIHMACLDLHYGNCNVAVVSGVMLLDEGLYRRVCEANYMASGIERRSFAEGRDGALFGEGAATVVLKPLSQAIKDKDTILATIKSTTSQFGDGSVETLSRAMSDNVLRAKVPPRTITHVECSANGSPFGDELEYVATSKVLDAFTSDRNYCSIGSVKPNIGHLGPASGMSQLLKVIMQMRNGKFAPLMNSAAFSPILSRESSPFFLCSETQPWPRQRVTVDGAEHEIPRRAMINSFGYGGFYAGAIVEEYIEQNDTQRNVRSSTGGPGPQVIVLSADDKSDLEVKLNQLSQYLKGNPEVSMDDLAYTLQIGREAMFYRWATVATGYDDLLDTLADPFQKLRPEQAPTNHVFFGCAADLSQRRREMSGGAGPQCPVWNHADESDLLNLASWWVDGGDVPWNECSAQGARRIALPAYPFAIP